MRVILDRLSRLKGPIIAIGTVGAVLSGFAGYWNTYKTVRESVAPVEFSAAKPGASPKDASAEPRLLSIVVLPFTNLSTNPEQAYFADGLTASITADLSRIQQAYIVSPQTAFTFRDKPVTAKQIGQDLGVRFLLRGSVQVAGTKIRISAQLTDTTSEAQLWSEAFDGDTSDLFALQDKVTSLMANSIGRELIIRAARESERRMASPTVGNLILKADALMLNPMTRYSSANIDQVLDLSRRALALDPRNPQLAGRVAGSLSLKLQSYPASFGDDEFKKAISESKVLVTRALADNPDDMQAIFTQMNLAELNGDIEQHTFWAERGIASSPRDPLMVNGYAWSQLLAGRPEKALAAAQQAFALDPKYPSDALYGDLAGAELILGNYDSAIQWLLKFKANLPGIIGVDFVDGIKNDTLLVIAYALKGDLVSARTQLDAFLALDPNFRLSNLERIYSQGLSRKKISPAIKAWVLDKAIPALRLAGAPT